MSCNASETYENFLTRGREAANRAQERGSQDGQHGFDLRTGVPCRGKCSWHAGNGRCCLCWVREGVNLNDRDHGVCISSRTELPDWGRVTPWSVGAAAQRAPLAGNHATLRAESPCHALTPLRVRVGGEERPNADVRRAQALRAGQAGNGKVEARP